MNTWNNDLEKEREFRLNTLADDMHELTDEYAFRMVEHIGTMKDDIALLSWLHDIAARHEKNEIHLDEAMRQNLIWLFSAQYRRMKEPPAIDVEFPYSPN